MTAMAVLHAWVDESIHVSGGALSEGIYILAAAVADPSLCEPVRDALRGLLPGHATRLHWRDGDARSRRKIAAAIATLEVAHTVIVGAPLDPRRQERARRLCLERMVHELASLRVSQIWLETRTATLNTRDRKMIDALRSRGAFSAGLTVDFAQPHAEPMLWLPDAVAGSLGAHRRKADSEPYRLLQERISEHEPRLS